MHLSRLKIQEFRNLRDFEVTFTPSAKDADGVVRDLNSHAVIGQNGSASPHRNYLYALGDKRTNAQNAEMTKLSEELSELGFASDFKDPYLEMFVKQMALRTEFHKDVLTPEEQAAQDKAASAIIDKILAERKKK